jgi:hypothetical protein
VFSRHGPVRVAAAPDRRRLDWDGPMGRGTGNGLVGRVGTRKTKACQEACCFFGFFRFLFLRVYLRAVMCLFWSDFEYQLRTLNSSVMLDSRDCAMEGTVPTIYQN